MNGAREYAKLFKTGQYDKLYIVSGRHARGSTFHIQILPTGEEAIPNGRGNLCRNRDAVEVYGIVCGQPGWTECYAWLYEGPWVVDFMQLVEEKRKALVKEKEVDEAHDARERQAEQARVVALLTNY